MVVGAIGVVARERGYGIEVIGGIVELQIVGVAFEMLEKLLFGTVEFEFFNVASIGIGGFGRLLCRGEGG
jgi:hypothetical protein